MDEIDDALRLPRVDESPNDEHTKASVEVYERGDYETALEEAVLARDPSPIEENLSYELITTAEYDPYGGEPDTIEKADGTATLRRAGRLRRRRRRRHNRRDAPNSLDGAYGSDPIYGGAERDFIDVSSDFEGGTADTVDCGRGKDEVMANPDDTIVPNREEVTTWDF